MEILPGIYQIQVPIPDNPLGHLNAYLIEGTEGWLMIDTGWFTPDAFGFLESGIKDLGLTLSDISSIVITHVHPDHYGLAGKIKQLSPQTELYAHRWEAELIESRYIKFSELQKRMDPLMRSHGVPEEELAYLRSASMPALRFVTVSLPDHYLYGGETISTGLFDLEVIWTPGHSPGHICLYESKNRLLFSGDHILPHITPNISSHVESGDNPLGDYICALQKLRNLAVSQVLPAHEDIFNDLNGRIEELINHHAARESEIKKTLENHTRTAYDISSKITWNVAGGEWEKIPPLQKRFAVTETIAHLDRMRWEGKVEKVFEDDFVLYRARK